MNCSATTATDSLASEVASVESPGPGAARPLVRPSLFPARLTPQRRHATRPPEQQECVVLVGRPADPEFAALASLLRVQRIPVLRIDSDGRGVLPESVGVTGHFTAAGGPVRPTACWSRGAVPGIVSTPADVLRAESWQALLGQVTSLTPSSVPGPEPGILQQLADAQRLGIRTPRTVIAADPRSAADIPGAGQLMVKTLAGHFIEGPAGRTYAVFPAMATRADIASRASSRTPVILQEYIPHLAEYRVYYVDGQLYGFDVRKEYPAALWEDPVAVTVRTVPVSREAAGVVHALARAWKARYAAFDLLQVTNGIVFLEANYDGDWRWFEARAATRVVSVAAAVMMAGLHLAAGGQILPDQGFDLLSFLTG